MAGTPTGATTVEKKYSDLYKCLASATRRRALVVLISELKAASASELAEELGTRSDDMKYHARRLRNAGLVKVVDTVPRTGGLARIYAASDLARQVVLPLLVVEVREIAARKTQQMNAEEEGQ